MGKRRTKKQKQQAKHTFSLSWDHKNPKSTKNVTGSKKQKPKKRSKDPDKYLGGVGAIKKDLAKSVIAFLFIAGGLVIYSLAR
ncbi:hypothetical protein ACFL2C_01380 [Patescibacteria group bacterium]